MKLELPWITGDVLIERWEISLRELHQIIFNLNLPVYNSQYEIETEPEERGYVDGDPRSNNAKWVDDYNNLYEFDGLIHRMKRNRRDNEGALEILESLYFKIEDVRQFESEYSINRNGTPDNPIMVANVKKVNSLTVNDARELGRLGNEKSKQLETQKMEEKELDEIISKIVIAYENDNELKISYPNKPSQTYTCNSIGFRDSGTKEWKTLIQILKSKKNMHNIGPAHISNAGKKEKRLEYDTQQKRFAEINKKLIAFLSKQYPLKFPIGYKLYERDIAEKPGIYKFKFQIFHDKSLKEDPIYWTLSRLGENKFREEVKRIFEELKYDKKNVKLTKQLTAAWEIAQTKYQWTKEDFSELIKP